jgi:hypothetical protein
MDITKIIDNIDDPNLKKTLLNVAGGNIIKQVKCLKCKKVIAHIYHDGQIVEVKNSEKSGCLSSRKRFDGYMGFSCRCGNWSIQSKQEQGIMGPDLPSKEDLQKIANRINKNPSSYKEQDGAIEVDGFIIEDFRG